MILLKLFWEFFKAGLLAVGGGLATLPFLEDMGGRTGWFSATELANMLAISESTPGPIGVNMATFAGFETAGLPGAVCATLGLITPSLLTILLIARVLEKFRTNRYVEGAFYGLRPASAAMVASAGLGVAATALLDLGAAGLGIFRLRELALALAILVLSRWVPRIKTLHPIVFIALSAAVGIALKL